MVVLILSANPCVSAFLDEGLGINDVPAVNNERVIQARFVFCLWKAEEQ